MLRLLLCSWVQLLQRCIPCLSWLLPQVLDFELQKQLVPYMKEIVPLPGAQGQQGAAAVPVGRQGSISSSGCRAGLQQLRRVAMPSQPCLSHL